MGCVLNEFDCCESAKVRVDWYLEPLLKIVWINLR